MLIIKRIGNELLSGLLELVSITIGILILLFFCAVIASAFDPKTIPTIIEMIQVL